MNKNLEILAELIKNSNNMMVMTGAGMDTESNIPDFRSKDGLWHKMDPAQIATVDVMYQNYPLFHEFYSARIKNVEDVKPHRGHYLLAKLEEKGYLKAIVTQNVSGLHSAAGNRKLYELHGNIRRVVCNECRTVHRIGEFLDNQDCSNCGKNALRPDIVLFGEMLPQDIWRDAMEDIENSDLLIVIGTSLQVSPVNQMPYMTRGKTVYINMEAAPGYNFDLEIIGRAGELLGKLEEILL